MPGKAECFIHGVIKFCVWCRSSVFAKVIEDPSKPLSSVCLVDRKVLQCVIQEFGPGTTGLLGELH